MKSALATVPCLRIMSCSWHQSPLYLVHYPRLTRAACLDASYEALGIHTISQGYLSLDVATHYAQLTPRPVVTRSDLHEIQRVVQPRL
ncbi:uncharacterized protein BDZ83DRAFT_448021 [Colletotrichum acutatum]|uniref:Uncharacterized protein n=1 Tax=Glomerella acutata TaxID=27357 RepID=A0AAD8XM54_GLOAC|nr:uncharacterized protein BDZ83DRAFT_448021 [Colletotrichum acutatum]KAK1729891.1 hypothetical protein BDZ83DRAFT_448021 [Colletotrichum acutatum]